jgi:hypothetical protein
LVGLVKERVTQVYNPTAAGGIVDKKDDTTDDGTGGGTNPDSIF